MQYTCTSCGLAVIVAQEQLIRACSCDAPVAASMEVVLTGAGGLA